MNKVISNLHEMKDTLIHFVSFLGMGISLILASGKTQNENFVLSIGWIFCVYAVISPLLTYVCKKHSNAIQIFHIGLEIGLAPLDLLTFLISIFDLINQQYFVLSIILTMFSAVTLIYVLFQLIKVKWLPTRTNIDKKRFFYRLFSGIGIISVLLGLILVFYRIINPEMIKKLTEWNTWAYDPLIYLAIAILCVFPILVLDP
jgi:hypothetical protein